MIFFGFRKFFGLNSSFIEKERQNDDFYIKNGGYVETSYRKNKMLEENLRPWKIDSTQWDKLQENISIIKKNEIPYVLIQAPITEKLYRNRTNSHEIDLKLSKLGPYKNFYGDLKLNDSLDFYDSNHMNQPAVEEFNHLVIDYIQKNELLKN